MTARERRTRPPWGPDATDDADGFGADRFGADGGPVGSGAAGSTRGTDWWSAVRRGPSSGAHRIDATGGGGDPSADELPLCFAPVERPVDGPVAPPEFGTARRGYDPADVDAYLRSLGPRLAAVETERQRADIAEDQLREALAELKRVRAGTEHVRAEPTPAVTGAAPADRDAAVLAAWEDDLRVREERMAQRESDVADRLSGAGAVRAASADLDRVRREVEHLADVRRVVRAELADLRRGLGRQLAMEPDTIEPDTMEQDGGEQAAIPEPVAPRQRTAGLPSRP